MQHVPQKGWRFISATFGHGKKWKQKYNDVIAELQQQGEIFEEMLEEKDNFLQELILVISDEEMKMETMEFDLDSAVEEIQWVI